MLGLKRLLGRDQPDEGGNGTAEIEPGFERVAAVDEIPPGTGKVVVVRGREAGVFNVEGEFHAIDNICPHSYRPIGTTVFEGSNVTCLWHGLKFDVVTGECPEAPHHELRKYRVEVRDGDLYVAPPGGRSE